MDSDFLQFELDIDAADRRCLKRKLYESDVAESVESFKGLDLNDDRCSDASSANKDCYRHRCRCKAAKTSAASNRHEVTLVCSIVYSFDACTMGFHVFSLLCGLAGAIRFHVNSALLENVVFFDALKAVMYRRRYWPIIVLNASLVFVRARFDAILSLTS